MIRRCECALGVHHANASGFETQECNRACYFVDKVTVDEENIWPVLDFTDNVGIPHFVEKGTRLITHFD